MYGAARGGRAKDSEMRLDNGMKMAVLLGAGSLPTPATCLHRLSTAMQRLTYLLLVHSSRHELEPIISTTKLGMKEFDFGGVIVI